MQAPSSLPQAICAARVFRPLVQTLLPDSAAYRQDQWASLELLVAETLGRRSASELRQLRLFLRVIEWTPVLRYGRRFSALDAARRERVLRYLQDHPLRLIRAGFWGLRTVVFLGHYGHTETVRALGYRPDPRGWEAYR